MSTFVATTTVVTAGPITLAPQFNNPRFQGWYINGNANGSLDAINCPTSSTWFSSDGYAACCPAGNSCSRIWTSCSGNIALGMPSASCGGTASCMTVSVFDQYPPSATPPVTQIICANVWDAFSIFRTVATTTSTAFISIFTSTAPEASMALPAASSVVSTIATSSLPSSIYSSSSSMTIDHAVATQTIVSSSPSEVTTSDSTSKAWIAAAVLGPLILLVIVVGLIWLYRRKKAYWTTQQHVLAPPAYTHTQHDLQQYYKHMDHTEMLANAAPMEVASEGPYTRTYEMAARNSRMTRYELPAKHWSVNR